VRYLKRKKKERKKKPNQRNWVSKFGVWFLVCWCECAVSKNNFLINFPFCGVEQKEVISDGRRGKSRFGV
jgi:hypothetical protein